LTAIRGSKTFVVAVGSDLDSRGIRIEHPELPPSENKIKVVRWGYAGGKRKPMGLCYSKEAEDFRKVFTTTIGKKYFSEIQKFVRGHKDSSVYHLTMVFHFETLVNSGWIKKSKDGKRKAKTLYKKVDTGNRRKLIEDCLSTVLSIDDSLTFSMELVKVMSDKSPLVEILLEEVPPERFGIPKSYLEG